MRIPLGTITSYDAPGENAEPPNLLLAMGHPAEVADASLALFRTLVRGVLTPRDRKLVTLAIAAELKNAYEWGHHTGSALTMGVTAEDLDAIRTGDSSRLSRHDRVIVELTWAIESRNVTDELWAQAAAELDTEQLVQLTVCAGYYGMLARIQSALQVDQDQGFAATY
jgi:4-carboxymuconolactone decarboxylase